jgi:hypothetical protein
VTSGKRHRDGMMLLIFGARLLGPFRFVPQRYNSATQLSQTSRVSGNLVEVLSATLAKRIASRLCQRQAGFAEELGKYWRYFATYA